MSPGLLNVYKNDTFPYVAAQDKRIRKLLISNECITCCGPNYLAIKELGVIIEDGICISCNTETKVFNTYVARHVLQKYNFSAQDYFKVKDLLIKDIENLKK